MLGLRSCFGWISLLGICLLHGIFSPSMVLAQNQQRYDIGFIYNFTKQMYLRHELDCFVTFNADRRLTKLFEVGLKSSDRSLHRALVEDLNLSSVTWGLKTNLSLSHILPMKTLIFGSIHNLLPELEPILEVIDKALYGRHKLRIFFVLKPLKTEIPSAEQLKEFFAWCWRSGLINVVLTFQHITFTNGSHDVRNELFSYNPFPKLRLLNVTSFGVTYKWRPIDVSNVQGYEFRVPVFQDLLKAFLLPNGQLCGGFGMLLAAFINRINGTLRVEATPDVNVHNYYNKTLLAATRGEIDIGAHFYTNMTLNSDQIEGEMTLTHTQTCLMVPWQRAAPLDRSSRKNLWTYNFVTLFIIFSLTVGWRLFAPNGYKGFYFALAIVNQQPLEDIVFRKLTNAQKFIHVSFLMGIFLFSNIRVAYVSMSLSTKLGDPQIKNLDDFMRTQLRIMLTETEVSMYFNQRLLPAELQQRLVVVNASTLQKHLDNLNTSYAYCSSATLWQLVSLQQNQLRFPLFVRVKPTLCTPTSIKYVPMRANSPFRQQFFSFMINSQTNGFYRKWEEDSFMKAVQTRLVKVSNNVESPYASLKLCDYQYIFRYFVLAYGACTLCFLSEIVWKHRLHLFIYNI